MPARNSQSTSKRKAAAKRGAARKPARKAAVAAPSAPARKPARKPAARPAPRRAAYHHGNLRQALIDAAVELSREGDPENVTVREAGRRAGVSSAAPFRHFPNRAALMGAVAAEALRRFHAETAAALVSVKADDPVLRLRAIGRAFIQWALRNPTHFRILSSRELIKFEQVPELRDDVQDVADVVTALAGEAQRRGQWPSGSTRLIVLSCRALVYGLSRMKVDGQLPQWGVAEDEAEEALLDTLELYVDLLGRAARAGTGPGTRAAAEGPSQEAPKAREAP